MLFVPTVFYFQARLRRHGIRQKTLVSSRRSVIRLQTRIVSKRTMPLNVLANFSSSGVHEPDVVTAPPQILSARVRGRSLVRLASVEQVPGNLKG